jgi:hypothetical protein
MVSTSDGLLCGLIMGLLLALFTGMPLLEPLPDADEDPAAGASLESLFSCEYFPVAPSAVAVPEILARADGDLPKTGIVIVLVDGDAATGLVGPHVLVLFVLAGEVAATLALAPLRELVGDTDGYALFEFVCGINVGRGNDSALATFAGAASFILAELFSMELVARLNLDGPFVGLLLLLFPFSIVVVLAFAVCSMCSAWDRIMMATVAGVEFVYPTRSRKVKKSEPLYPLEGVYTIVGSSVTYLLSLPWMGCSSTMNSILLRQRSSAPAAIPAAKLAVTGWPIVVVSDDPCTVIREINTQRIEKTIDYGIQGRAHINSRDRGKHGHEDALQLGAPRGPLHFPTERVRLLQRVEVGLRTLNALAVFLHLNTNCTNDHTIPE